MTDGVVGRGVELALLRGVLEDVVGGRGGAVLVEGEPGIGKSALLRAALGDAEAAGCAVLTGACDELEQRLPLSVPVRMLGVDEGVADPRRAAVAVALSGPSGAGLWNMAGDPVLAALEQLLGLVERLAVDSPLVLVVEDLHWADEATLLLWRRLCRTANQSPLLVVGSFRPAPARTELGQLRREVLAADGALISLGGLPREETAAMAAGLIGAEPGPLLLARLAEAGGNPLFVRELVDALGRAGAVRVADGIAEVADEDRSAGAVASLSSVIADRLDFLSHDVREVLRTAAVLGPDFSVSDLAVTVNRSPIALTGLLEQAMAAGMVEPDGARLRFRHGLLRQAMYEAMPTALRAALVQHAAQALIASGAPAERVAALVLVALPEADGWEVDWIASNAAALAHRAPAIVAELLEHALQKVTEDDPRRDGLQDRLGLVALLLGRWEQAVQIARGVMGQSGDPERIGQASWILARCLGSWSRFQEALEALEATAVLSVSPAWRVRLDAHRSVMLVRSRPDEAHRAADEALAAAEPLADPVALVSALQAKSFACGMTHDWAGALHFVDRALDAAGSRQELVEPRVNMLGNRLVLLDELDRSSEAGAAAREAIAAAERFGVPERLDQIRVQVGVLAYVQGRWDDALVEFELAARVTERSPMSVLRHVHLALIAGHRDQASDLSRSLDLLGRMGSPVGEPGALLIQLVRALEAERSGSLQQGVGALAPYLEDAPEQRITPRYLLTPTLVRLALATGDALTARAAAEVAEKDAERRVAARYPGRQQQAVSAWCRGLLDTDPEGVLSAAAYYRTAGRLPMLGAALEDAAVLQAVVGDPASARATLAEALDVHAELGAVWTTRRALARLRPHGVRPGVRGHRQRPGTGWGSLTETELRVAELVAQGYSNPDIAVQLMLSRRTVETHVSHILRKLQARSRNEVVRHVPARG